MRTPGVAVYACYMKTGSSVVEEASKSCESDDHWEMGIKCVAEKIFHNFHNLV